MFHRLNSSFMLINLYIRRSSCGPCDNISSSLLVNSSKSILQLHSFLRKKKNNVASMKAFQSIQADFALLGICTDESRKKRDLNAKSWIIFSSYVLGTISSGYYFIYADKSFEQYIKSYSTHTCFLVCVLQFANLFWQMPKLTAFFLTISDLVQQRK